ncbi:MAG: glucokinase [Desulfobulbaceae bacterium]|jgi:glucokinase|nr:glucokinase [Desulfobulbaceae bacterium]
MGKSKPKPSTSATSTSETILAVDLGGSKCQMAVYHAEDGAFSGFTRYASRDFTGIEAALRRYQAKHGLLPNALALAVAGPVDGDKAHITNLGWRLEKEKLRQAFAFDTLLLVNDLTAVCAALPFLAPNDLLVLQEGKRDISAPAAVLAPGTGLGEGILFSGEGCQHALGSEGGHCDFAPVNDEQIELLRFMRKSHQSVSYEMLAAGPGMIHLFEFCQENSGFAAKPEVVSRLAAVSDKTPVIIEAALAADFCPLCRKSVELFLQILGAEAGNLALKTYARNGLYLAGGILPRLVGKISFAPFVAAFRNKKMMAALLAAIPIFLVRHPHPALLGAALLARTKQKKHG